MNAKRTLQKAAVACVAVAGAVVLFAPAYSTASIGADGVERAGSASVLQHVGPWTLLLVLIPAAIAAVPLVAAPWPGQSSTIVSASLMVAWGIVGAASIGVLYWPAILCSVASVFAPTRSPRGSGSPRRS
ncbi:hypothetical protein [Microbacterium sp. Root53]|uniref:hypothetical protein n=1 Tax=Microbacterium sp. Root53 TaxID=1736553 RepID=UPI0012E37C39|nr:hypothetical protein [Microbacterium sp. Root53]